MGNPIANALERAIRCRTHQHQKEGGVARLQEAWRTRPPCKPPANPLCARLNCRLHTRSTLSAHPQLDPVLWWLHTRTVEGSTGGSTPGVGNLPPNNPSISKALFNTSPHRVSHKQGMRHPTNMSRPLEIGTPASGNLVPATRNLTLGLVYRTITNEGGGLAPPSDPLPITRK